MAWYLEYPTRHIGCRCESDHIFITSLKIDCPDDIKCYEQAKAKAMEMIKNHENYRFYEILQYLYEFGTTIKLAIVWRETLSKTEEFQNALVP